MTRLFEWLYLVALAYIIGLGLYQFATNNALNGQLITLIESIK
jgi:hypothetical protein